MPYGEISNSALNDNSHKSHMSALNYHICHLRACYMVATTNQLNI